MIWSPSTAVTVPIGSRASIGLTSTSRRSTGGSPAFSSSASLQMATQASYAGDTLIFSSPAFRQSHPDDEIILPGFMSKCNRQSAFPSALTCDTLQCIFLLQLTDVESSSHKPRMLLSSALIHYREWQHMAREATWQLLWHLHHPHPCGTAYPSTLAGRLSHCQPGTLGLRCHNRH